jgi:uncharacterized sulfatase
MKGTPTVGTFLNRVYLNIPSTRLSGREGLTCMLLLFSIAVSQVSCTEKEQDTDPNIILILADDLGWSQLGCYGGPYTTPNIDQLAAEGIRFTNAYAAAAVCSPTRAALMTGKYPARLHLTDFIKGGSFPDSLLQMPAWQKFLPLEEVTIAEMLKKEGYYTGCFGKWHLSQEKQPPESAPYNPDKQGFDEYLVTYKPSSRETDPEHDPHNVDSITDRSIRFLEEHKDKKFFLYVPHNSIHDPLMESAERIALAEGNPTLKDQEIWPVLAAMVNRLDSGVGRLLRAVDRLGLKDNTMVIFYSDNGGKARYARMGPLRKGKGWLYEGGIRVPLIVRWPGKIEAGAKSEHMVSSIDFKPTFSALTGADMTALVDGKPFLQQLFGAEPVTDRTLYWHYPHYHGGSGMKPAGAVRDGRYKLIEWYEELLLGEQGAIELYDLENDIGEQHNLVGEMPQKAEALQNALHDWRSTVQAQMPTPK